MPHPAGAILEIETTLAGERAILTPQRALVLPERDALLVADTHWGKTATMRAAGIPIPGGNLEDQISRLSALIARFDVAAIYILGDLLHAPAGSRRDTLAPARAWRESHPDLTLAVVAGNHDRMLPARHYAAVLKSLSAQDLGEHAALGPFDLLHNPDDADPAPGRLAIAGHVHPAVTLAGGGDALKLPCYHLTDRVLTLPAFSAFTAGAPIRPAARESVFAIAGDRVVML